MVWTLKSPVLLGDSQHVGGDDYNKLMNMLAGVPVDTITINSPWTFGSGVMKIADPTSNFAITFQTPNLQGNVTLNLPLSLTGIDNLLASVTPDIVKNKTVFASDNTITDYNANAGDLLVHDGNSFNDFPRGLGFQVLQMTSDGTGVQWSSLKFWDPNLIEPVTNKIIDPTVNVITDPQSTIGALLKHDGHSFKPFPMGMPGQMITVADDGTDVVWMEMMHIWNANATETLTNKTINSAANTITLTKSTISDFAHNDTHDVSGNDAFTKNDVLAAKCRYTELMTPNDPSVDTGRTWVNAQQLKYWDDEPTPQMQVVEVQGNRGEPNGYCDLDMNGQVPVGRIPAIGVKANLPFDTVFLNDLQTLTNKTIVLENNIITSLAAQIGSILTHDGTRFKALPPGATNQTLQTKSDGTLQWATVGTWNPAAVEAFISKTITAAQNKLPDVDKLPSSGFKNGHVFWPIGNIPIGQGLLYGVQLKGNLGIRIMDGEGQYKALNTGGTPNSPTGFVWLDFITRRSYNPRLTIRFRLDKSTNNRLAMGFTNNITTLPTSDTLLTNSDTGILVGFRPADVNYTVFLNNGTGTMLADGSSGVAKDTSWHKAVIQANDATPSFTVTIDGGTPIVYGSTQPIPASTTPLAPMVIAESTQTNQPFNVHVNWMDIETIG